MSQRAVPMLLLLAGVISACEQIPTDMRSGATPTNRARGPVYSLTSGECGGQTDLGDSRVKLTWTTLAPGATGIGSDGSDYAGGEKGVHAKIFYHDASCAQSGDVVFDPDKNSYRPARKLVLRFPAGSGLPTGDVQSGSYANFAGLMQLGSDVTWDDLNSPLAGRDGKIDAKYPGIVRGLEFPAPAADQPGYPLSDPPTGKFRIQYTGITGCEALEYDQIHLARTGGIESFEQLIGQRSSHDQAPLGQWRADRNGVWTIESVATGANGEHLAQCYHTKKGNLVTNGGKINMPFTVTVSEIQ